MFLNWAKWPPSFVVIWPLGLVGTLNDPTWIVGDYLKLRKLRRLADQLWEAGRLGDYRDLNHEIGKYRHGSGKYAATQLRVVAPVIYLAILLALNYWVLRP
jgi:hypothetical protein